MVYMSILNEHIKYEPYHDTSRINNYKRNRNLLLIYFTVENFVSTSWCSTFLLSAAIQFFFSPISISGDS